MDNPRFSLEEFKTLFPDRCESPEKLLSEYQSFLLLFEELDGVPVPELSASDESNL